jgi:hypothetical protein
MDAITREARKANRRADRFRGQEIENVALESYHRGRAVGLLYANRLLREHRWR